MSYEFDPITNELIDRDPSSDDLGKRLLNTTAIFDDEPRSMKQEQPKSKGKLNPKEYKQISYKQLIGNIDWEGLPKWDKGSTNSFKWLVDRSNPKIKLPQAYLCEATMSNDNNLNLKILNGSEILYELDLKPAKVY